MNIDSTTFAIVMGVLAAVFAVLYMRTRVEARFSSVRSDMENAHRSVWSNMDELESRISEMSRRVDQCCTECKANKSYYNSGT
jgi:hypothetical protein